MIIGITGGTGCGKTTLLHLLKEKGCTVLDCDEIYHSLLETDGALLCAIEQQFPNTVIHGKLDRKRLGQLVFSNESALLALNEITHSAVKQVVVRQLEAGPKLAAIDAIALFEGALAPLCHTTVAVLAPKEERILRLMKRDGISREYAQARIAAQHDDDWFRERCQYVLINDSTPEAFQSKCLAFLHDLDII